jgi:hypothetical protein
MAVLEAEAPVRVPLTLGHSGTVYDVADVSPIIEKMVADLNVESDFRNNEDRVGGLERLAHSWAARGDRTPEASARRLWAYRNHETKCIAATNVDELFVSQGVYTSDFDLPIFAGSRSAGFEMAQAYLMETKGEKYTELAAQRLGRTLYHFTRGYFAAIHDAEEAVA